MAITVLGKVKLKANVITRANETFHSGNNLHPTIYKKCVDLTTELQTK